MHVRSRAGRADDGGETADVIEMRMCENNVPQVAGRAAELPNCRIAATIFSEPCGKPASTRISIRHGQLAPRGMSAMTAQTKNPPEAG
jgi:hypothetical protein